MKRYLALALVVAFAGCTATGPLRTQSVVTLDEYAERLGECYDPAAPGAVGSMEDCHGFVERQLAAEHGPLRMECERAVRRPVLFARSIAVERCLRVGGADNWLAGMQAKEGGQTRRGGWRRL